MGGMQKTAESLVLAGYAVHRSLRYVRKRAARWRQLRGRPWQLELFSGVSGESGSGQCEWRVRAEPRVTKSDASEGADDGARRCRNKGTRCCGGVARV